MRQIIALITLLFSTTAFAQDLVRLNEGDMALSPIEAYSQAVVHNGPSVCPPGALCAPMSHLRLQLAAHGCADSVIEYHDVQTDNMGNYDVYITALNVHNELSTRIFCIDIPRKTVDIFLSPGVVSIDSVNIHYVGKPVQNAM